MDRHSLITGGAGFIGSHLAEALLSRSERVTVLDDLSTGLHANLDGIGNDPRLRFVVGSADDQGLVEQLLSDVDAVYHLAAAVGVRLIADAPIASIQRNIRPTETILAAAAQQHRAGKPTRVFLASSSEVYGKNPAEDWNEASELVFGRTDCLRWSYGAAKAIDEFLALAYWREFRLPVVIGRFFNVVGPRQRAEYGMVLPRFIQRALAGKPPTVHDDGQQVRCFAHVLDVAEMVLALMETEAAVGQIFNVGSDQPTTIEALAQLVVQEIDPTLGLEFESYRQAYSDDFEDIRVRVPNLAKVRQTIAYQPRFDLQATVRDCIAWHKAGEAAGGSEASAAGR